MRGVSIQLKPNRNSLLGRKADITINRYLGSRNIRHKNTTYNVNIGYLSAENVKVEKQDMIDKTLDDIKNKYGFTSISRASKLNAQDYVAGKENKFKD